jgi:hypothetical protein
MDGWPHLREGALALRESFDPQGLSELIRLPRLGKSIRV